MPTYRLYRMDPHSGRLIGTDELPASDDASAIEALRQRAHGACVELWDGRRKILRIDGLAETVSFAPIPMVQPSR